MSVDDARLHFQGESMWLLNLVIALIMFGISLDLRPSDFKHVVESPKGPLIGLSCQFILLPALTFLLTLVLRVPPSIALGMILVAACPGGNLSNFLTHFSGGNTALSVSMSAISTIAAMVMTPFNLSFWGGLHPQARGILHDIRLEPLDVVVTVVEILVIPLLLGMACARWLPVLSERLHKPFKRFSIAFFLLFVIYVFAQNFDVFLTYIGFIAFAVILHNGVALATGYSVARLSGCPPRDVRAIAIEVGIQNSALGLALVFTFFGGLGGMALIAGLWGIWHIISGLSLAWFWSKRPVPAEAGSA